MLKRQLLLDQGMREEAFRMGKEGDTDLGIDYPTDTTFLRDTMLERFYETMLVH